jgi:hypothetical protein
LRFFQWIDGKGDDVGVLLFEFCDVRLVVGYLPNAVGSPDAAVEEDDGIFAGKISGDAQCRADRRSDSVIWKLITGAQLFRHLRPLPSSMLDARGVLSVAPRGREGN